MTCLNWSNCLQVNTQWFIFLHNEPPWTLPKKHRTQSSASIDITVTCQCIVGLAEVLHHYLWQGSKHGFASYLRGQERNLLLAFLWGPDARTHYYCFAGYECINTSVQVLWSLTTTLHTVLLASSPLAVLIMSEHSYPTSLAEGQRSSADSAPSPTPGVHRLETSILPSHQWTGISLYVLCLPQLPKGNVHAPLRGKTHRVPKKSLAGTLKGKTFCRMTATTIHDAGQSQSPPSTPVSTLWQEEERSVLWPDLPEPGAEYSSGGRTEVAWRTREEGWQWSTTSKSMGQLGVYSRTGPYCGDVNCQG